MTVDGEASLARDVRYGKAGGPHCQAGTDRVATGSTTPPGATRVTVTPGRTSMPRRLNTRRSARSLAGTASHRVHLR